MCGPTTKNRLYLEPRFLDRGMLKRIIMVGSANIVIG